MAATLLEVARGWGLVGLLVAAVFLLWGIGRVDPAARGAIAFRPLLVPGIVLLWPLVLWRWWGLSRGREVARGAVPRRLQDGAALLMAVAIPAVLLLALLVRQDGPHERPAVLIAPPPGAAE